MASFELFCAAAWERLGFVGDLAPVVYPTDGLVECRRATVVRRAEAGTFTWEERWLLVGLPLAQGLSAAHVPRVVGAVQALRATDVAVLSEAPVEAPAHDQLHQALAGAGAALVVIAGSLARTLVEDTTEGRGRQGFSFGRLRRAARAEVEAAFWRGHYQPERLSRAEETYLPQTVKPLHADADANEADLVTAVAGGSCLLLGPPGAGKTTALVALAAELARAGGRTGVLVRLGAYPTPEPRKNGLLTLIGQALGAGAGALDERETRALLETGALTVMLDGLNEVQEAEAHAALVREIDQVTEVGSATARARWVVTGRDRDYQASLERPRVIEERRWHMEPLSDDLIARYLQSARGEEEAKRLWGSMDVGLRDMCRTPLHLSMLLGVQGEMPLSRGALYRRVMDDLLLGDEARGLTSEAHVHLVRAWPALADPERRREVALDALTAVAAGRQRTVLPRTEAAAAMASVMVSPHDPPEAAGWLLEDLLRRGVLLLDTVSGIRFRHHTFQEFFLARRDIETPLEVLLPEEWKRDERVPPDRREALRLLASLRSDTAALVKRVLALGDAMLALEMAEDQPPGWARGVLLEPIARRLAERATTDDGSFVGQRRRVAQAFVRCAARMGTTPDGLIERLFPGPAENVAERIATLYSQLGDVAGQRRALARVTQSGAVPKGLRWRAAQAAHEAGEWDRAVALWTEIIDDPKTSVVNRANALGNRANAHKQAGHFPDAERDYRTALALGDDATWRANLALLLLTLNRLEEAETHARNAVALDPLHANSHSILADVLEARARTAPQGATPLLLEALDHRDRAVRFAPHAEDLLVYLRELITLQETLGRHEEALTSYNHLLSLQPFSDEVQTWREKIHFHRIQAADERARRQDRSIIVHDAAAPPALVLRTWLDLVSDDVTAESSMRWRVDLPVVENAPTPAHTLVVLLPDAKLDEAQVARAADPHPGLSSLARKVTAVLLVATTDEHLTREVQTHLSTLRGRGRRIGLLSLSEVRDAITEGRGASRRLFGDALEQDRNPFQPRGIVKIGSRFWGRRDERAELSSWLAHGRSFGLYGIHKVGKSSLLGVVRHHARTVAPEITCVAMELDATVKTAADFYGRLTHHLYSFDDDTPPPSRPRRASAGTERASSAPGSLDVPVVTSALEMRRRLEQRHREGLRRHPGHRLALLLDEYAYLIPDGKKNRGIQGFDEVLGLLKTLVQEGWFVFVPCGRTAALSHRADLGGVENPFVAMLPPRFLLPMPREDHHAMMTDLAAERPDFRFTDEALDRLFAESGGHPLFARHIGAELAEHTHGVAGVEDVEWAVSEIAALSDMPREIFENRMNDAEQLVAQRAALSDGGLAYGAAFPKAAPEHVRMRVRDGIRNLVDTGVLVEEKREGKRWLTHRIGLLRTALLRRAEDLGLENDPGAEQP